MEVRPSGNGQPGPAGQAAGVRFFLEEEPHLDARGAWAPPGNGSGGRLQAARAALIEAQRAEWAERRRLARAQQADSPAALLKARQAQTQTAQAAVEELRRRAAWLRQAIALGEEAIAAQRRLVERLRRELAAIGE